MDTLVGGNVAPSNSQQFIRVLESKIKLAFRVKKNFRPFESGYFHQLRSNLNMLMLKKISDMFKGASTNDIIQFWKFFDHSF